MATIIGQLPSLELREPPADAAAVYDRPIQLRLLHEAPESGEVERAWRQLAQGMPWEGG